MIIALAVVAGWVFISVPAGILIGKSLKLADLLDRADRQLAEY